MSTTSTEIEATVQQRYTDWRSKMPTGNVISASQFDRKLLELFFTHVTWIKEQHKLDPRALLDHLRGLVMMTFFETASTRTRGSFEVAMLRLGGTVSSTAQAGSSSLAKGETPHDHYRVLGGYGDVVVMRSKEKGTAAIAASASPCPVINGGDGSGEHPTQALLDALVIWQKFGKIDNLTVTMFGDLLHGRTVHSLARLLALFKVKMRFVSPEWLMIPKKLRQFLIDAKVDFEELRDIRPSIPGTNFLYVTRPQFERMTAEQFLMTEKHPYAVPTDVYHLTDRRMLIHHPLPRTAELPISLDDHPDSICFKASDDGVFMRMGLLDLILRRY